MRGRSQDICLLTAEGRKERRGNVFVPEVILALFLLSGVLIACKDMMYSPACLKGAVLTGVLVLLILQVSELSDKTARGARLGIYMASILCFVVFILYIAQGFLDTVNRFGALWNLRFQTEFEQFAVNSRAVTGAVVFWCLISVSLAALLLMLVKRRSTGLLSMMVVLALLMGFVLGRSQMWGCVLCMIGGSFGTLVFTSAPGRQYGIWGLKCITLTGILFLSFFAGTNGYEGLDQIARWRADAVSWFERFRYGEDTLPKGNLAKAQGLLDGENETLRLAMETAQECYLKGFVGADYDGIMWKNLPMEAYQGEYEGLLKWLETKDFSVLRQFAQYNELTETAQGTDTGSVRIDVENTGAYRKFVYLPATAENWEGGGSKERKDWQVRSNRFFGTRNYSFQAVSGVVSADGVSTASWMQNPSGKAEKDYLDAESVYHSFAKEYYMDVDDDRKAELEELFFPEEKERDFNEVTAQIRRVLRQETRYVKTPPAVPSGKDFVDWFLNESHRGNAIHYASVAVLAYRTAGYPARYVEGYHYAGEETAVVLTNQNAHAWVEVYVPGVGWMPVEVVPGMYTEMYTNQIVEGEPAFQVNADSTEDGLEIEGGQSDDDGREETPEQDVLSIHRILSMVMLSLYLCLILYLALEAQRIIRRMYRRRAMRKEEDSMFVDWYAKEMGRMLLTGKVRGNYNHPLELSGQVEEKIDGISADEYIRAVGLLQKVRFGGKKLKPHELHTLECFLKRLAGSLSRQAGVWGRFKVRYWYVF